MRSRLKSRLDFIYHLFIFFFDAQANAFNSMAWQSNLQEDLNILLVKI